MKQVKKWLPILMFVLIIFGLTGYGLVTEEKTYSATEKRELQTRPKAKKKTIKNGKFQKKYETYLSDQFPGRDEWVALQTNISRLFGKKESNGVYFGKDDYLLEQYDASDFDEEQMQTNIDVLVEFVNRVGERADVKVMMVPTKTWVMQEKLPLFAPTYDEQIFYDALHTKLSAVDEQTLIPVDQVLFAHRNEEIYYRTDHHWTTWGAWYGYSAYAQAMGISAEQIQKKSDLQLASSDFLGTTYAKVHQAAKADEISVYEPQTPLEVIYNMGEKTTQSLYETEFLDTEDQYRVFTGGNQAVMEITGGIQNGKTLLLIKDSFANCMLPFLVEDFEKVIVVDLRQLNVGCDALVDMFAPTDVLVLYNSAQFVRDRDFAAKCK
ncbi:MAG: DHHW family protein [Lachnospiraceae bacterium]|nr:DHHW family protein [Lachnospiraceae bacterium]